MNYFFKIKNLHKFNKNQELIHRTKNKILKAIIFLLCTFSILIHLGCKPRKSPKLLQICPDEWYLNSMPSIDQKNALPAEYFIIDGERRELKEFDLDWIRNNCEIKEPSKVY